MAAKKPSKDAERLYRSLRRIRRVEEEIARIYPTDKIKSPVHLSIGQEGIAVGVCDPLEARDAVSRTYSVHATYLAKGGAKHPIDMAAKVLGNLAVVGNHPHDLTAQIETLRSALDGVIQ